MLKCLLAGKKEFLSVISPHVKSSGVSVTTCQKVQECLVLFRREKCDFAILQENFEDGTGESLTAELKKTAPNLIVIVSLGRRDADRALQWMESGVYECLYEPINANDVRIVVQGVTRTLTGTFLPKQTFQFRSISLSGFSLRSAVVFLALVLAVAGGIVSWRHFQFGQSSASKEKNLPLSFRLPYPNPTGITWDGKNLWISDWSTQTIYKHHIDETMSLDKFFPLSEIPVIGLSWGDSALWTVGQDGNIRKHMLDGRLTVTSVIKVQGETPSAIAWDGKNLWSCDAQSRKIYRHNMDENLSLLATYDFPGKNPVGMVWAGKDLWICDEGTGTLYRLHFDGELFTLQDSVRLGVHLPGTNKLSGVCYDGKNLWTISEGNGLIFRHPISTIRNG